MNELDKKIGWGPFAKDKQATQQREIYVCTFSLIALLVGSDGEMSKDELEIISQLIKRTLKLDAPKKAFVQSVFNETKRANVDFSEMVNRYKIALIDKPNMYMWLIDVLLRLALADGVYTEEEHSLLQQACKTLGLPEDRIKKIASEYGKTDLTSYYKLFDLAPGVDLTILEQTYDKLMDQNNVNKLIELGFGRELIELAQERQAMYMEAFLKIRKAQ